MRANRLESRRLVLAALPWHRPDDPPVPLGHASLMASASNLGVNVSSVVQPVNGAVTAASVASELLKRVDRTHDLVDIAIGAYVWNDHLVRAVLRELRRGGFTGRLILGGPQISYAGSGLEETYPAADVFIRGYAEETLAAVAASGARTDMVGVHYAGDADPAAATTIELAHLRSPWLEGTLPVGPVVRWETKRGCPYHCSFCQHRSPGCRPKLIAHDLDRLFAEIDMFCDSRVERINVLDPVFNVGGRHELIVQRFIERGFNGQLVLQCRAERLTEDFLDLVQRLNARLEFGLQTIHEDEYRAVDRYNDMAGIERTLSEVLRRNIEHEVSIIYGLPNQTLRSFKKTVAWCLGRAKEVKAFPLMLLRGTKLDAERARWQLVEAGDPIGHVVASSTFSPSDQQQMVNIANSLTKPPRRRFISPKEAA